MMKFVDETGEFGSKAEMFEDLYQYMQQNAGFDKPVSVHTISNPENGAQDLGKTAYYDPTNFKIVLYTDNRHIKDILRSFAHELIHHKQNCEGNLKMQEAPGEGYAQNNDHLRNMELDAYKNGNINFRDWEDQKKKSIQEKIKKDGGKWLVTTKDGSRVLGSHDTEKDAIKQLKAIEANKMNENENVNPEILNIFNSKVAEYENDPSLENYLAINQVVAELEDDKDMYGSFLTKRLWKRVREIENDRVEKDLPVVGDPRDPMGTRGSKSDELFAKIEKERNKPPEPWFPPKKKDGDDDMNESKNYLQENKYDDENDSETLGEWLSKERQIVHSERLGLKMNLDNLGKDIDKKTMAENMGISKTIIDIDYGNEDK